MADEVKTFYEAYSKGTDTYIMDGDTVIKRSGGSPNLRNNNPGNIEAGPFAASQGAIGSNGRFAIFKSQEDGIKAAKNLLKSDSYQNAPGHESLGIKEGTVGAAIYKWAPPNENDVGSYIKDVERYTGLKADTPMSQDPAIIEKTAAGIFHHEGHDAPSVSKYKEGLSLTEKNDFRSEASIQTSLNRAKAKQATSANVIGSSNYSGLSSAQLKEYVENDKNFAYNVLDDYDNPTYLITWWAMDVESLKEYESLPYSQRLNYKPKTVYTIYRTGSTTDIILEELVIDSVGSPNGLSKKTTPVNFSMSIMEPNACALIDNIRVTTEHKLGYKNHVSVPFFLDIQWVGYNNMNRKENAGGQTILPIHKRIKFSIVNFKANLSVNGFRYSISCAALADKGFSKGEGYGYFTKGFETGYTRQMSKVVEKVEDFLNQNLTTQLSYIKNDPNFKNEKIYRVHTAFDSTKLFLNSEAIKNSGESAGTEIKQTNGAGTSIEEIIDNISRMIENNDTGAFSLYKDTKTLKADTWPMTLGIHSDSKFLGVAQNGMKVFAIDYTLYPYYLSDFVQNDYGLLDKNARESVTSETVKILQKNGCFPIKKYDFLFTSKNHSVINADLNLDMYWFAQSTDIAADNNRDTSGMVTRTDEKVYACETNLMNQYATNMDSRSYTFWDFSSKEAKSNDPVEDAFLNPVVIEIPYVESITSNNSSITRDVVTGSTDRNAALYSQLYKTGDLVKLKLTIRGDPYWLIDITQPIDADGTPLIRCSDPCFFFNIKAPVIRQNDDTYILDRNSDTAKNITFSGLYKIIKIRHRFNKGQFTQEIEACLNTNVKIAS